MTGKWKRWADRLLAGLLGVMLCCLSPLGLAESDTTTPEAATPTAQAVQAETPSTETTAQPPTQTPTPTSAPTPTLPPETTGTPTATDSVTDVPTQTTVPEDTQPVCDIPDCPHVTVDAEGNTIAVCPLGVWMLAHPTATPQAEATTTQEQPGALLAPSDPSTITLGTGTTTLYRSGSYILTGGSDTSCVIVSDHLAVAIELAGATLDRLTLGSDVTLQLAFTDVSTISQLHAGTGTLLLNGKGSLTIADVDDISTAKLTMAGGNIHLPSGAVSLNENHCYLFNAAGATAATVDGVAFPFTTPDDAGSAYLWLPTPDAGTVYQSAVTSGTLVVRTVSDEPSAPLTFSMDGTDELTVAKDQSYAIVSAGAPLFHAFTVDQTGVTLLFTSAGFGTTAEVNGVQTTRLLLQGYNQVSKVSGKVSLTGTGTLHVATLAADTLACASTVTLRYGTATDTSFSGWQRIEAPVAMDTVTKLTYKNKNYAMAYASPAPAWCYSPLPAPSAGMRYDAQLSGTTLEVTQVPLATQTLTLTDAGLSIADDGNYVIVATGTVSGNLTVAAGVTATMILRSIRTTGRMQIGDGAEVTLSLEGSNLFSGTMALGSATILNIGGKGALQCDTLTAGSKAVTTVGAYTNVTLKTGNTMGGSTYVPTVISVTGADSAPLKDLAVTLKIGTAVPFQATTAANGHVTLWGKNAQTNAAVVVLSQADTYADILTTSGGTPDALPEINDVTIQDNCYVTYNTVNAESSGVQYYVNRAGATMPDTFDSTAKQGVKLYGECNFPNLMVGDVVTFRVYAAREAGQSLSAKTADAFQFSKQRSFTVGKVRPIFTLASQSKEYDMEAFSFASGVIPKGASVTYYKGDTALSGAPTDVGKYTIKVLIPAGRDDYQPGLTSVSLTIKAKVVWIYPEVCSKIKGQPDPSFYYTYSEMFNDDAVTGALNRVKGEFHGNYPYLLWGLTAPSYYELKLDPESPMFFIDWGPGHYIKVDPFSIIDPVHQTIIYTDGTKLDLVLKTTEKLTISKTTYGALVTDTLDRKVRPFSPEMRLKHGYDQVMLILQAEPEINDDGGYATDADGKVMLRGRTLSLSPYQLSRFANQRITTIGFRLNTTLCTLDLSDLTNDMVKAAMTEAGISMNGARFQITLTPINGVSDLNAYTEAVQTDKALGATMMGMRVEVRNGENVLDIAPLMTTVRTMFDVSALLLEDTETVPGISEVTIGKKAGETVNDDTLTVDTMEQVQSLTLDKIKALGILCNYYTETIEKLDSRLVVPYTASEAEALPYTAIMQTSPYLMVKLTRSGLYGLSQTTWQ